MDGMVFLKNLMNLHPMPAIIISSESFRKKDINKGAIGFVEKPKIGESMNDFSLNIKNSLSSLKNVLKEYDLIKPKINIMNKQEDKSKIVVERKIHPDEVIKLNSSRSASGKIITIGSSTGGVEALLKLFKKLKSTLPPIVITQHIPYKFSNSLANRLNDNSLVSVVQAEDGMILKNGCGYLAPGNMHLTLEKKSSSFVIKLLDSQKVSRHKPSVDVMFRSVNNVTSSASMAIMMTGMGDDGSIAMKELYDDGAYTLAQNEESCVVFGMPKVAIDIGAVKDICHLDNIASYIEDFSNNKRK
jgi:two-component system chemotaxis response regulator CheB